MLTHVYLFKIINICVLNIIYNLQYLIINNKTHFLLARNKNKSHNEDA